MSAPHIALATVTSESFVPGTLVLLRSFLTHNPWFRGEIVVIADDLSEASQRSLEVAAERVRFLGVSKDLTSRIAAVVAAYPSLAPLQARFHALETFRLRGYDRVLFCDSDLLFRASVEDLLQLPEAFIAAGDIGYYAGRGNTFNSGFMLIDRVHLTEDCWRGLLDKTEPQVFEGRRVALADQIVLSAYFAGRARIVSGACNFLLACHQEIAASAGLSLSRARVVHFNFGRKPWMPEEALGASTRDPVVASACAMWQQDFADCLEGLALRASVRG